MCCILYCTGEVLESSVTEWVLRHASPGMDELSFARPSGLSVYTLSLTLSNVTHVYTTLYISLSYSLLRNVIGELYATQFFSAKKLKFILFLPSGLSPARGEPVLQHWSELAETFRPQALFSYMYGAAVPDVLEYFGISEQADYPMIVCHDPVSMCECVLYVLCI